MKDAHMDIGVEENTNGVSSQSLKLFRFLVNVDACSQDNSILVLIWSAAHPWCLDNSLNSHVGIHLEYIWRLI
jgi:hypothetical protein